MYLQIQKDRFASYVLPKRGGNAKLRRTECLLWYQWGRKSPNCLNSDKRVAMPFKACYQKTPEREREVGRVVGDNGSEISQWTSVKQSGLG